MLSGCETQVEPITSVPVPDENKLNGINSAAWPHPVIGHPEGKPYSSRIMRLFSNPRKGSIPAHSPTAESPTSVLSNDSNSGSQSWSGLAGLGVMDSFKKLRSSVLQGIQSKGAANHLENQEISSHQEMANGAVMENTDAGLENGTSHFKKSEQGHVSNGNYTEQTLSMVSQYGSDIDDYDEDENDGSSLTRNSRVSRSIKRAYGAGRISLCDTGKRRSSGSCSKEAADFQKPDLSSKYNVQTKNTNHHQDVKVIDRKSVV